MKTRIRELRKARGLTLQQLAEKVGTTAQTIQRLETGNMTISLGWLEKISNALGTSISKLLIGEGVQKIELVGMLGMDGRVAPANGSDDDRHIVLTLPGLNSIAVRVEESYGSHQAGTVLLGSKLNGDSVDEADGRECIVGTRDGAIVIRHAALEGKRLRLSAPSGSGADTSHTDVDWVAPIMMSVRYFP